MKEHPRLYRFLEIFPGALAWTTILMPIILAPFYPIAVAYFILIFNLYWLFKALNMARHLIFGHRKMKRYMATDWYSRCKKLDNIDKCYLHLEGNQKDKECRKDLKNLKAVHGSLGAIKKVEDVHHVIVVAIYKEDLSIVEPTIQSILDSNYPSKDISIVLACEEREPEAVEVGRILKKKYASKFHYFEYFAHPDGIAGEVKGKGGNITYAGREYKKYFDKHEKFDYENVLVSNIDGDHIPHPEYLGRLTYRFMIDPNRNKQTYQPVALLFNNIWDTPAINRVVAASSSFWQVVESLRPFRQRTFAAHAQSLRTLAKTDFWAVHTIVEDGHQFWRTYFQFKGRHEMVPLFIPVYQDAVLMETYWETFKGQYKQRRRWAWGASDLSFIVTNFMKHKDIPIYEKIMQTFRHASGLFSWATASFLIIGAWIPLIFNEAFQETVLAHNLTLYASNVLKFAWIGLFINVWVYLALLPPRPHWHGVRRNVGMILQWILTPIASIVVSALPALDSQTRLMLGKRLEFWTTPKIRRTGK